MFFFKLVNLTLYIIETSFNIFTNRADLDQAALVILELPDQCLLCLLI